VIHTLSDLHVSSDIIAHHQELLNCVLQLLVIQASIALHVPSDIALRQELLNCIFTASGDTLIALHVSSDIIAHHQELLNFIFTASGDNYLDCSTCFELY